MGKSWRGEVTRYYLTGQQLEEVRKGAKCDLENRKEQRSQDFALPKTKGKKERYF